MSKSVLDIDLTRHELATALLTDLPHGGLFIRTDKFIGLGETLQINLNVPELGDPVFISGSVAWHRRPRAWSSTLPSGLGFGFDPSEASLRQFLIEYATGRIENRRIQGTRTRVEYPVKVFFNENYIHGTTIDLGNGGIRFMTSESIPVGSSLDALIFSNTSPQPPQCLIQVLRVDPIGHQYAIGARFQRLTPVARRSLNLSVRATNSIVPPPPSAPPGSPANFPSARQTFSIYRR